MSMVRRSRFGLLLIVGMGVAASPPVAGEERQFARDRSQSELLTVQNDKDVFPTPFRGKWAADRVTCRDPDGKGSVQITANRMTGYESDAVLLKNALMFEAGPNGREAYTILALLAVSGEGELGIEKVRVSLSGRRLYFSREPAAPSQHWTRPLIRCSD
jgi:hypothetical protein